MEKRKQGRPKVDTHITDGQFNNRRQELNYKYMFEGTGVLMDAADEIPERTILYEIDDSGNQTIIAHSMAGAFENIGYCKKDKDCIYNVRIMDEHQINIALGAGGISKMYYPEENRLERVPNVTNYQEYIKRIDEMLDRKENNIFKEVE